MYMSTDNIEVEVNEVESHGVDWDRDKCFAFTNFKMELLVA